MNISIHTTSILLLVNLNPIGILGQLHKGAREMSLSLKKQKIKISRIMIDM